METDFTIRYHRNSDNLHLKPAGCFDETAARVLTEALKRNIMGVDKIFVHTSELGQIESIGREKFHTALSELAPETVNIIFTGENGGNIIPKGMKIM